MNLAVVVIPVYSTRLSHYQTISIEQCFKVLQHHEIFLVCPDRLDVSEYLELAKTAKINLLVQTFESKYFESIWAYNQLLLSPHFYKQFSRFSYLLLYQNDAFVFRDELIKWCNSGFDYIGAPWFEGYGLSTETSKIIGAGNGGFSLRNVQSSIRIMNTVYRLRAIVTAIYSSRFAKWVPFSRVSRCLALLFNLSDGNIANLIRFDFDQRKVGYWNMYEDLFWSETIPVYFKSFKVATFQEAMYFSFECQPRLLYEMTHSQLPFGCHAWEKYDREFWSNFIKTD